MGQYSYRIILPSAAQMSMRPISPYYICRNKSVWGQETAKIFVSLQERYTIRSQSDLAAAAPALLPVFPALGVPYALCFSI